MKTNKELAPKELTIYVYENADDFSAYARIDDKCFAIEVAKTFTDPAKIAVECVKNSLALWHLYRREEAHLLTYDQYSVLLKDVGECEFPIVFI